MENIQRQERDGGRKRERDRGRKRGKDERGRKRLIPIYHLQGDPEKRDGDFFVESQGDPLEV